jgi:hypothetical protein
MNRNSAGTGEKSAAGDTVRRSGGDVPVEGSGSFPAELYGVLTQIMLYVRTMDEDYNGYTEKERDR